MEVVKHSIPENHLKLTALVMYVGEIMFYSIKKYIRYLAERELLEGGLLLGGLSRKVTALPDNNILSRQVEVLWNKGAKKLDPLFPLLVKGRNLYKMKTYRQLWKNEKERLEVLDEKHRRGNAARAVRDKRRTKTAMNKNESLAFNGGRHCKRLGPSKTRETSREKNKCLNEGSKQNAGSRRGGSASDRRHHNSPNLGRQFPSRSYNYPSRSFFPSELHNFHSHGGFASVAGLPYPYPCPLSYSSTSHTSRWRDIRHGNSSVPSYSHSTNENEAASYNYPRLTGSHQSLRPTAERHQRR